MAHAYVRMRAFLKNIFLAAFFCMYIDFGIIA